MGVDNGNICTSNKVWLGNNPLTNTWSKGADDFPDIIRGFPQNKSGIGKGSKLYCPPGTGRSTSTFVKMGVFAHLSIVII